MKVSIKTIARFAGLLYLINIVFGFFAIGYVPGVVISKDIHVTAQNIIAHEQLYRFGLVAHIVILLTNIPLAVIFWRIFKPINNTATLLVVFFTLLGTAVETSNLLNQFAPLVSITNKKLAADFTPDQLASLSYMFYHLQDIGVNLAFVFFGFYGICMGYIIITSTVLPKIIGVLMTIGGLCYVFNSLAVFLSPKFAASLVPFLQIPSGAAELTLCLWLLIAGINTRNWPQNINMPGATNQ